VPARTSRLWVRVGGRDVTARFRRTGGSRRVARLTRGDGLRYGPNLLSVLAERRGGRPVAEARSFVVARRQGGLVRLRIRPGSVTSLNMRVAGAPRLAPEHFGKPGEVERRLSVIRRERTVRVWLNGRRVTRALDGSEPTRWTGSLSASHALRYGVNRLRILVAEPDRGRYALVRRRLVVNRSGHLAAAGWDVSSRIGGRVRLDGRRSRTTHGGRPQHSWRILSGPRGSRAKLRRARSARPLLTPDRPGRYVVALRLTERTRRATAAQTTGTSADTVEVTAGHASPLVAFKGLTVKDGHPGIQVGDTFYPNPSPNGSAMQWLTLDRATLTPCDDPAQPCGPTNTTGNSWLDGTDSKDHGVPALTSALSSQGLGQLVILSYPYAGGPGPPVQQGQIDAFNGAMKAVGVGPISASVLQDHNKLAIVGVPKGGDGSGWYTHGGGPVDALTGWLMPDATAAGRFRFQPERPAFDTSSSSTSLSNTMSIRGDHPSASLPDGVTGGFHVVQIDPIDFRVVSSDAYGSNGAWDGLGAMVERLRQILAAGGSVAVQSIGHPTPSSPTWPQVAFWLSEFGANPDTFTTIDDRSACPQPEAPCSSYAFLGAPELEPTEVAESSHAIVTDPTTGKRESGTLRGRARIRSDGYFMPVATDTADALTIPLYDIVFQDPTPWPYTCSTCDPTTPGATVDVAAYTEALADITASLPDLKGWGRDLRQAYVGDDTLTYSDSKTDLLAMPYRGDGQTCAEGPDPDSPVLVKLRYTRDEFCKLSAELQKEFDWLDATQTLFNSYDKVLNRTGNQQQVDLKTIGTTIHNAVAPPSGADISSPILQLIQSIFRLGGPVGGAISGAIGVVASSYELGTAVTSNASGAPVGDRLDTTVDELASQVATSLSGTAGTLDSLRDIVISDYGRLNALGSVATSPAWSFKVSTMTRNLTTAAQAYFSSALVPVAYDVWYLMPGDRNPDPSVDNCWYDGGTNFSGAPASAQLQFHGHFNEADDDEPVHLLVLAHQQGPFSDTPWYPPAAVTDPMFTPIAQGGDGVYAPGFFWSQYPNLTPRVADCITE
jgi:hypothetical protein